MCDEMSIPPEPPVGTWVRDRFGAVAQRFVYGGWDGWSPPGCYPFGRWDAMWEARGPLVECEPWGLEPEPTNAELWV